jgi:hypothetical protein
MSDDLREKKKKILAAGEKAVNELIKVLEQPIISPGDDLSDLAADKMKNAAAAKRLAFEDAISIVDRIEQERNKVDEEAIPEIKLGMKGFAEGRVNGKK